ncbi:MAG TPA: apolipoprotein N-acyltransferase [Burkholderiales bacterium]|nr:apolipoprotein N-acyltransferase [Burkholderiales bacterium]
MSAGLAGIGLRAGPLVAAFLAGAVSVSAFGDWNLFALPVLALGALFLLWNRVSTPRRSALLGLAFGAGLFLVGVSWVYVSLHDFGMMPAPLAATATLLFCLYLALFPAAVGYLQARLRVAPPFRLMLAIPALWTLGEWVRAWLFTGFPWLALGYSQADGPLAGFAPVLGVLGLSFLGAVAAGAVATLASGGARNARAAAAGVLVALGAAGWGLHAVRWTTPAGEPLAVSLVQGNIPQELKFVDGRYESTLATYARLVERSTGRLIVLPEIAIPRFLHEVAPDYIERLKRSAAARGGDLLLGVPVLEADRRYYNAVVSLGASPTQGYAKSHLVPFGEFVPPGFGWVVTVLTIPLSDFARGSGGQRPLQLAGQRVAPNICYEDAFGTEIIRQLPEATLLANVSNVAWFGDSLAPAQHLRIARMRSIETGRTMLRATNTGVTAIVDPRGAVTARLPSFTEGVLEGRVQGYVGATPYVRVGNAPVVAGAALIAAVALGLARRAARNPSPREDLRPPA